MQWDTSRQAGYNNDPNKHAKGLKIGGGGGAKESIIITWTADE